MSENTESYVEERKRILPCPYPRCADRYIDCCKGEREGHETQYYVTCVSCGTTGPLCDSMREAVDAWNSLPRH